MQFALVNLTTGQVVGPFNSERSAGWERDKFPAEHDCQIFPIYGCVQWALDSKKGS